MSKPADVSFFLLLVLYGQAHGGRLLLSDFNQSTSSDLISDGVHHHHRSHTFAPYLTLKNAEDSTCEQTCGFLPCTTTVADVSLVLRGLRAGNSCQASPPGLLGLPRQHTLDLLARAFWPCSHPCPSGSSTRWSCS